MFLSKRKADVLGIRYASELFTYDTNFGFLRVKFKGKPNEEIRNALKSHGFRWNPKEEVWWRRKIAPYADLFEELDKRFNPDRTDGDCRECESKKARWVGGGAFPKLLCKECADKKSIYFPTPGQAFEATESTTEKKTYIYAISRIDDIETADKIEEKETEEIDGTGTLQEIAAAMAKYGKFNINYKPGNSGPGAARGRTKYSDSPNGNKYYYKIVVFKISDEEVKKLA